jgi:hypothetical protein
MKFFKALHVYEFTRSKLQDKAIVKHIYIGREKFTAEEAIKISAKRSSNIDRNTVFEKPKGFRQCKTDDPLYPTLTISSHKVRAFQCTKNRKGIWEAEYLDEEVYVIFSNNGSHFPGYLYKNISWPHNHY